MIQLYLDPGSGSFLIQLLIAAIAGMSIAIGANWSKIKRLIGKKKNKAEINDEDDEEQQPDA
jgi:Na+-transporting methylmalonyl-CoA/oxaloacetate decarboxylase gamma subunit